MKFLLIALLFISLNGFSQILNQFEGKIDTVPCKMIVTDTSLGISVSFSVSGYAIAQVNVRSANTGGLSIYIPEYYYTPIKYLDKDKLPLDTSYYVWDYLILQKPNITTGISSFNTSKLPYATDLVYDGGTIIGSNLDYFALIDSMGNLSSHTFFQDTVHYSKVCIEPHPDNTSKVYWDYANNVYYLNSTKTWYDHRNRKLLVKKWKDAKVHKISFDNN